MGVKWKKNIMWAFWSLYSWNGEESWRFILAFIYHYKLQENNECSNIFFLKKHRTCNVLLITIYEHVSNVELYRWTAETVCYYYMAPAKRMCCIEMCEVLKETHFRLAYFSFVSYNTGLTSIENKLRPEVCVLMFPWVKMWIINPLSCSLFYCLLWGIESVPHWAFDIW